MPSACLYLQENFNFVEGHLTYANQSNGKNSKLY